MINNKKISELPQAQIPLTGVERLPIVQLDRGVLVTKSVTVADFSDAIGVSGYSGKSGYSGFSGYSGYSGRSGISGFSGRSGFSGNAGDIGASGFSGFTGRSGYSGKSGFSGVSGYSGYSSTANYFDSLSANSILYDGNGNVTEINYTTGNKQTVTYEEVEDILTRIIFRYYGTNGSTLIATYTVNFVNNQAVSAIWS